MSLGDDLMKLSLNGLTSNASPEVPVAKGKIPTLGDVKKSLRVSILVCDALILAEILRRCWQGILYKLLHKWRLFLVS